MSDHETDYKWRVSEKFWLEERKLTEEQYHKLILACPGDNAGFCESCMGNTRCEVEVLGIEEWRKKNVRK